MSSCGSNSELDVRLSLAGYDFISVKLQERGVRLLELSPDEVAELGQAAREHVDSLESRVRLEIEMDL